MSVRRLADASVQPAAFAFNRAMTAEAKTWIKKYPKGRQQSAVIPLLMLAQEQDGWVTKAAIEHVAETLQMPYIRVLEVATFYTQFQLKPVGTRAHIQVCGTTPCAIMGAGELMDVCRSKIHHEQFHTNADGTLSWEEVECLGACVNAPMVMVFKDTYEDLTPERLAEIIDAFEAGKGDTVKPGPQTERWYSAPATGFTSLKVDPGSKAAKAAARADAKPAAKAAEPAASLPPSNAAKPKTHSENTNEALKSPSKEKVSRKAENGVSVRAPALSSPRANLVSDRADKPKAKEALRERKGPINPTGEAASYKSPELKKAREKPVDKTLISPSREGGGARTKAELVPPPVKPKAAAKPAKPTLEDKNRPAGIAKPKTADDLKLISGVGPKIEKILHELGIYTFAQVASWQEKERAWVDSYLNFKGRIDRDDWVQQAKALAKGGVAEYIRVFGKKPV